MKELVVKPMQWMQVKDLHDTPPLDGGDLECMKDVRAALAKHGKLGRFALHLVHKHFDIAEDEVLVEFSDAGSREQFFRVEKLDSEAAKHSVPTTWTLETMEPLAICVCAMRLGNHLGRHESNVTKESRLAPALA